MMAQRKLEILSMMQTIDDQRQIIDGLRKELCEARETISRMKLLLNKVYDDKDSNQQATETTSATTN